MTLKSTLFEDSSGNYISSDTVWYDGQTNRYLWHDITGYGDSNTDYEGGWVLTSLLGPELLVDGTTWTGSWFLYNGERYWTNGTYYLWYDSANTRCWIISKAIGGLTAEQWDSVNGKYVGDDWYSGPSDSPEGQYNARGSNNTATTEGGQDGTPKNATFKVDGYRLITDSSHADYVDHVAPAGNYEKFTRTASVATDGTVTETVDVPDTPTIKTIGVPVFEDGGGKEYIRSFEKEKNGEYTFGSIYYADTADYTGWIIGTYGRGTWWEGEDPLDSDDLPKNSVTFTAYTLDDEGNKTSSTEESDKSIDFKECRMESKTEITYYGQPRLWL